MPPISSILLSVPFPLGESGDGLQDRVAIYANCRRIRYKKWLVRYSRTQVSSSHWTLRSRPAQEPSPPHDTPQDSRTLTHVKCQPCTKPYRATSMRPFGRCAARRPKRAPARRRTPGRHTVTTRAKRFLKLNRACGRTNTSARDTLEPSMRGKPYRHGTKRGPQRSMRAAVSTCQGSTANVQHSCPRSVRLQSSSRHASKRRLGRVWVARSPAKP